MRDFGIATLYRRDLMWFTVSKFKPDHERQCRLIGPAFVQHVAACDRSKEAVKHFGIRWRAPKPGENRRVERAGHKFRGRPDTASAPYQQAVEPHAAPGSKIMADAQAV